MNLTYSNAKYIRSLAFAAILSLAMLFAFLPASVQASSAYGSHCIHKHKVQYGETLSDIAVYHGLPVRRLAEANHLHNPNRVRAGQWLCIPKHLGHGGSGYGHTSYGHGKHAPPKHHYCSGAHYVVRHGDTLSEIAQYYG